MLAGGDKESPDLDVSVGHLEQKCNTLYFILKTAQAEI